MRVFECNECGEVLSGADDAELLARLREHMRRIHEGSQFDEEWAREMITREAYTASDS